MTVFQSVSCKRVLKDNHANDILAFNGVCVYYRRILFMKNLEMVVINDENI